MDQLKKIGNVIAHIYNWVACVGILAIMVVTCGDVIGRSFRRPISGAYDLVSMFSVVAFSFALAYTHTLKSHTSVDFLITRLPERAQRVTEAIVYFLSFGILLLFGWRSAVYARSIRLSGEVTMTIQLPYYYFIYGMGLACLLLCLLYLIDFLQSLLKVRKK